MRRTRANPSPSGLKALPMNEPKKRKAASVRKAPAKRPRVDQPKAAIAPPEPPSHPSGMMTDNMREREAIYFQRFGTKMPKPRLLPLAKKGIAKYGPAAPVQAEAEDESEEDLGEEYMDGPSFTQRALDNWVTDPATFDQTKVPVQITPRSTDNLETQRKLAAEASGSRPSTTHSTFISSKPLQIIIPGTSSETQHILTRPDLVDAAHSLAKWAKRDPTRKVPTPAQMEAMLDSFYAQEQAKIATSSAKSQPKPLTKATPLLAPREKRVDQQGQHHVELASGQEENAGHGAFDRFMGNQSEVNFEKREPQTPVPQTPKLQTPAPSGGLGESRGIWAGLSAVKNLISTPINYFRRSSPTAEATNRQPVTGEFSFRHPHNLPQTEGYPSTPMPSRRPRKAGAQTERRARPQTPNVRLAQTDRRRRPVTQLKPIQERGVLTQAEIAEIHRQQDREKQRRAQSGQVEDEDADAQYQSTRFGEKRKRLQRKVAAIPSNTFSVPLSSSDSDSDGAESEAQIVSPLHNYNIELWPGPKLNFSDHTKEGLRQEYSRKYQVPLYQVPKEDQILYRMFRPWQARMDYVNRGRPPIDFHAWDLRQKAAERNAADRECLPLWPGTDTPYGGLDSTQHAKLDLRYRERDRPRTMIQYRHLFPSPEKVARTRRTSSLALQTEQAADNDRVPPYTGSVVPTNANLFQQPNPGPFPRDYRSPSVPLFSKPQLSSLGPLGSRAAFDKNNYRGFSYPDPRPKDTPVFNTPSNAAKGTPLRYVDIGLFSSAASVADPRKLASEKYSNLSATTSASNGTSMASPSKASEDLLKTRDFGALMRSKDAGSPLAKPPPSFGTPMAPPSKSFNKSAPQPATSGTFGFSYGEDEESDDENDDVDGSQKTLDLHTTGSLTAPSQNIFNKSGPSDRSGSSAPGGPLEPKKWTQTPPPKPRPVNAQLPQQQAQPAANNTKLQTPQRKAQLSTTPQLETPAGPEISLSPAAKATAKALKFAPAHPSGLRNMTKMSPLQIQQENLALQGTGQKTFGQMQQENPSPQDTAHNDIGQNDKENPAPQDTAQNDTGQNDKENLAPQDTVQKLLARMQADYDDIVFDPVVANFVNAIPLEDIYITELPDHLYSGWENQRSVPEKATDQYFT